MTNASLQLLYSCAVHKRRNITEGTVSLQNAMHNLRLALNLHIKQGKQPPGSEVVVCCVCSAKVGWLKCRHCEGKERYCSSECFAEHKKAMGATD